MPEILHWPKGLIPRTNKFWIIGNSKDFVSPFNKSTQTVTLCLPSHTGLRQLEILIAQMASNADRVYCRDFAYRPRPALGAPNIKDAGQQGRFVATRGWLPSRLVLRLGDYVSIGGELKRLCADVSSTPAGEATLQIVPPLRVSPQPGDPVEIANPVGVFKLPSGSTPKPDRQPGIFTNITIEFEEVLC